MEAPVETPVIAPPKLRGWFHLGATPVVVIASLVLFILSKESLKFAVALYSLTAITLFSVSAIYHRVPWSPAKKKIWRRWDHANINLLIAGSYTPFAMTLLEGTRSNYLPKRCLDRGTPWRGNANLLARCTALALCHQLSRSWLGRSFLHSSTLQRGWLVGPHSNPDRWPALLSRCDLLCPKKTGD